MISLPRLWAVARKETIQLKRDPRSLAMAFLVPAAMIVFFGYIISFDVKDIRLAVLDQDQSQRSRQLVQAFEAAGRFRVTQRVTNSAEIAPLLDKAVVRIALVIPPGFQKDLDAGRPAPVQAIVDGADANTASVSMNYATAIIAAQNQLALPIQVEPRVWYNEALESANMIVPGLVAVIMMIISAMLTALTIAREWERGTMEQLAATPVHPVEVIGGKLVPYLVIGMIDVTIAVTLGLTIFAVPLRGSALLLLAMAFLFLLGSLGLGIFISAALKSQLLATQLAMLATYLPSVLLSGLMFDIASMPLPLRIISTVVPARYFVVVLRGVFLKGVGLSVLWPQAAAMVAYAVVGLGLAVNAFKKEIA
ncbi:MAG TPA: ABC transporter permease [Gemmatimonadales bacterium]|jgi:ABC-2 type transport system permease protein